MSRAYLTLTLIYKQSFWSVTLVNKHSCQSLELEFHRQIITTIWMIHIMYLILWTLSVFFDIKLTISNSNCKELSLFYWIYLFSRLLYQQAWKEQDFSVFLPTCPNLWEAGKKSNYGNTQHCRTSQNKTLWLQQ